MASSFNIDNLQIQIDANAKRAQGGIEELVKTLTTLKNVTKNLTQTSSNLNKIALALKNLSGVKKITLTSAINQLESLSKVIPLLSGGNVAQFAQNLNTISIALSSLSAVPKSSINLTSIASGITSIMTATATLDTARLEQFSQQMRGIAAGLAQLNTIEKSNLGSVLNQLKRIPELTQALDPATMDAFSAAVERLTQILAPLAAEMESVSKGFGLLPSRMRSAVRASNQTVTATNRLSRSYGGLFSMLSYTAARFWTLYYSMQRIINIFAEAYNESNEYIENLNLFTVSMGDAAEATSDYIITLKELMGIDPAEWMQNQGVFQRMATGFGISAEQAEIMSQNLTQLAYDMSSFFNTDVETAMQKLQSGMSGQIKGLKAWGYNLSVAALQETALALGIEQSVRTMTEAQKAQLRYITLIKRSNGVMNDMARTINTPANAMRILTAQMTQLKRAFGNIISIVATKLVPYVQAFVEVLAEAANSLAALWGFTLPKIDYSNLDLAADITDEIAEGVGDTEKEISKLKKQLMGFDELNILKNKDDDESGSGAEYDLGFKMPGYDFLEGFSDEYRETIDEIKGEIEGFIESLSDLTPVINGLIAIFAFEWITGAIAKFKKLKAVAAITNVISGALQNGQLIFEGTGSILQGLGGAFTSVWKSFKNFMSGLSPITKGLVSIIGLAAEFSIVKDAVYDFAMGTDTLGEMLLAVVPICGAVGVAMYAMYGPIGVVVTALAGLTAAVVGASEAEDDLRAQLSSSTFYNDQGTKIDDLADSYSDLMDAVVEAKQPLLDAIEVIDSTKESAGDTAQAVKNIATQFELGYIKIDEYVPLIKAEFDELYDDTLDILNKEANLIYTALAGSTGKALEDMGFNLKEVGLLIGATVNNTTVEIERLKEELNSLNEKFAEGGLTNKEAQRMSEIALELAELSGVDTSALDDFKDKLTNLFPDDINWETDDLTAVFDKIATSTSEATTAIDESTRGLVEALEHLKSLATSSEDIAMYDSLIAAVRKDGENQKNEIKSVATEFVNNLQTELIKATEEQYNVAAQNWDSMNPLKKLFFYAGNEAQYTKQFLEDYKKDTVEPIVEKMKGAFSEALGKDAVWADSAMERVMDALFKEMRTGNSASADSIIMFSEDIGKAITEGLSKGMLDNPPDTAVSQIVADIKNGVDKGLKINSPSKEMELRGLYIDKGLAWGISKNANIPLMALSSLIEAMKTEIDSFASFTRNAFSGIGAKGILSALPFSKYASGGFPSTGEMFIAREAGPELVGRIGNKTAVANNNQIITGIASAVYNAMMAAKEDGGSGGSTARIILQVGERVIGETAVEYINGQIVQTGTSPIYG